MYRAYSPRTARRVRKTKIRTFRIFSRTAGIERELGVVLKYFRIHHPFEDISGILRAYEYARNYFRDPFRKDIKCIFGYIALYIGSNGDVYSGCWVMDAMGNIRDKKIKEILYTEKYYDRLHRMLNKYCPGCSCGYASNVRYDLKSIFKEARWKLPSVAFQRKEDRIMV